MSFIIACLMLFFVIGLVGKEKTVDKIHEEKLDEWEASYDKWKQRNYDQNLKVKLMDFIDDESNYEAINGEMAEFFKVIPELTPCAEQGFALYPHQCIGTKKEREETSNHNKRVALFVMLANRGKVYNSISNSCDCGMLSGLRYSSTPRIIDNDVYLQRYKWYEQALVRGGMSKHDAEICYVPLTTFNTKTKKMEVLDDTHFRAGQFAFKATLLEGQKKIAKRLW